MKLNKILLFLSLIVLLLQSSLVHAQLDIPYTFLHKSLPDKTVKKEVYTIYSSPTHMDAKSVARGRTNMMLGLRNNAMWQNPAFLSYSKLSVEVTNAQLIIPQTTVDAISFVREYNDNFKNGKFLTDIRDGLNKVIHATNPEERQEGLAQYNEALSFLQQMSSEIAYSSENPNIHGISVFPKLQVQYKNWGISLYKSMNIAFAITPGNLLDGFTKTKIDKDMDWDKITEIAQLLYHSFDSDGNISANGLPRIFAVTFDDWIGILGYGKQINKNIRLGANLKIIGRGFSTDAIDSKDSYDALERAYDNISTKYLFVTADLGGLYHLNNKKTTFGLNLKNIIPNQSVPSEAIFNYTESKIEIPKDSNGDPYVGRVENNTFIEDPTGDTLIYSYAIDKTVLLPFELRTPFLLNFGVHHKLIKHLELNMDMVDILAQDNFYYNTYFERLRVGAEYRVLKDIFALRVGMAEFRPTAGFGINLFVKHIVLDLDMAYAYNRITNSPAYFVQLNIGFRKTYSSLVQN